MSLATETRSRAKARRRRQHRINQRIKQIGIALACVLVIGLVLYGIRFVATAKFVPGKEVFLRDVYILVDQTRSLDDVQRREAKPLIREQILDRLGPGDRVFCYRIDSNFDEIRDRVFVGDDVRWKVPHNLAGVAADKLPQRLRHNLSTLWSALAEQKRIWWERLAALEPEEGDQDGATYSDYLGTLASIGPRINDPSDPNLGRERFLIIVGDLEHDHPETSLQQRSVTKDEKKQYSGSTVFLVFPAGANSLDEQDQLRADWQSFFENRGNKQIGIVSFDQFRGRFRPSVVPTPEVLARADEKGL